MRKAKQHLLTSLVVFAAAFITLVVVIGVSANGAVNAMNSQIKRLEQPETIKPAPVQKSKPKSPHTAPSKPQPTKPHHTPPVTPKLQHKPHKPEKELPPRIPFTNKEVTPGKAESYLGTYGQCPFYENAMEGKGCVPPPDIECNEDWSVCQPKGE